MLIFKDEDNELQHKPFHKASDSMKSLVALYIAHGYPSDLVLHWLKDDITEQ